MIPRATYQGHIDYSVEVLSDEIVPGDPNRRALLCRIVTLEAQHVGSTDGVVNADEWAFYLYRRPNVIPGLLEDREFTVEVPRDIPEASINDRIAVKLGSCILDAARPAGFEMPAPAPDPSPGNQLSSSVTTYNLSFPVTIRAMDGRHRGKQETHQVAIPIEAVDEKTALGILTGALTTVASARCGLAD